MVQRVYFSIQYCDDIDRVKQVTSVWRADQQHEAEGRWYDEEFMSILPQDDEAVEAYIDRLRKGAEIIVILIGERTAASRLVQYEITRGYQEGIPMLGIYIHQ